MSGNGIIRTAYLTDRGQVREHNEDFVTGREPLTEEDALRNGWIYVVADGVGGADAGEIASSYASERTIFHYINSPEIENRTDRLKHAIESAHQDLCDLIDTRDDQRRMGTTLVAAVFAEETAILANVGDSRGYHLHNGQLTQVTKDHSLVAKLLEEGIITSTEADTLNIGNIILQSIGSEQPPSIDVFPLVLKDGDALLLCSDGLTNMVDDSEIAKIVGQFSPEDAAQKLVDLANERGGFDNITTLIMRYQPTSKSKSNGYYEVN